MSNKDSLESLKIDTSKLKEHKVGGVQSVPIKIYLDPDGGGYCSDQAI